MLKKEDTALVLIDVQGKLASLMHEQDELIRNLEILIKGATFLNIPILWLEQYPEGLGETVPEIKSLLKEQTPIAKRCFSSCLKDEFMDKLREINCKQILVSGIESHICVYQTVRDLLQLQYEVEVVVDAVSSRTKKNNEIGLQKMFQLGAKATSVEMALFELLKEAVGDEFKQISKLVK